MVYISKIYKFMVFRLLESTSSCQKKKNLNLGSSTHAPPPPQAKFSPRTPKLEGHYLSPPPRKHFFETLFPSSAERRGDNECL